jgi:hypothetical protein
METKMNAQVELAKQKKGPVIWMRCCAGKGRGRSGEGLTAKRHQR